MKIFEIININYVIIYIVIINMISFIMFGLDKRFAINNNFRISEKSLLILSLLGGSVGAILGMKLFRHKTKKIRFNIGIPIILSLQIAIIVYLCYNGYVI